MPSSNSVPLMVKLRKRHLPVFVPVPEYSITPNICPGVMDLPSLKENSIAASFPVTVKVSVFLSPDVALVSVLATFIVVASSIKSPAHAWLHPPATISARAKVLSTFLFIILFFMRLIISFSLKYARILVITQIGAPGFFRGTTSQHRMTASADVHYSPVCAKGKKLHFLHLILTVRRLGGFSCTETCTGIVRNACSCALANRHFEASKPPL